MRKGRCSPLDPRGEWEVAAAAWEEAAWEEAWGVEADGFPIRCGKLSMRTQTGVFPQRNWQGLRQPLPSLMPTRTALFQPRRWLLLHPKELTLPRRHRATPIA